MERTQTYQQLGIGVQSAQQQVRNRNAQLAEGLGVYDTLADLRQIASEIAEAEKALWEAERRVEEHDLGDYARAKEELDLATLTASMTAPADGKNAEQRKMQLDFYLATCTDVMTARAKVQGSEQRRFELEGLAEAAKITLHQETNRFKAMCLTAELQNRMLAILSENVGA